MNHKYLVWICVLLTLSSTIVYAYPTDWCVMLNDTGSVNRLWCITNSTRNVSNNYYIGNLTNNITQQAGGWVNDSLNTNTSLTVNIGSKLGFRVNNIVKWTEEIYQNGVNNFLYLGKNAQSGINSITISQSGRMGIQQPDNIVEDDSFFNGTGQNFFNVWGTFTGDFPRTYIFTIFNYSSSLNTSMVGYKYSIDAGALQTNYVRNWTLNLSNIVIEENLTVNWTNITSGIVNGTTWVFTVYPKVPHGTLSIYNPIFEYAYFYNVSANITLDRKYESSTTQYGSPLFNDSFRFLDNGNASRFYVGRPVMFRSMALIFSQFGVNANATVYYCNGTDTWSLLRQDTNLWIDGTFNYTRSGTMTWDLSTLNWSSSCTVNGVNNTYWMIFNSSRDLTTPANLYAITPLGQNRFEIYATGGDILPSVYYDADLFNFNLTQNRLSVSGISNYGTLTSPTITTTGVGTFVGVAVGGALSTATTGAFSGLITSSIASTLNTLSIYAYTLISATATTSAVPIQGSPLLAFVTKIWNGTADTNQEYDIGTVGDNVSKTTTLVLFNRNNLLENTSILNITHSINSLTTQVNVTWSNNTQNMYYANDNGTQRMCLNISQTGLVSAYKC